MERSQNPEKWNRKVAPHNLEGGMVARTPVSDLDDNLDDETLEAPGTDNERETPEDIAARHQREDIERKEMETHWPENTNHEFSAPRILRAAQSERNTKLK